METKEQDIVKIPLTQGKFAIIDARDFDLINKYKWHYKKSGKTSYNDGYAARSIFDKLTYLNNKKVRTFALFMHNFILNPTNGLFVDHINNDGLDNRRCNLRLCNINQNHANVRRWGKGKYRGVYTHHKLKRNPYEAKITVNGKPIYLGTFATEELAAICYNKNAKKYFGEFAKLNSI